MPDNQLQFRKIEPLGLQHKKLRTAFACGVAELDRYLQEQASQDAKRNLGVTQILLSGDGQKIAGFYTLGSSGIRSDDFPPEVLKSLGLPGNRVIGVTLLGRLARDLSFRGQGVGELLLLDAVKTAFSMSKTVASVGVIVDAKNKEAIAFYRRFGFVLFPDTGRRMFLAMGTIAGLFQR